MRVDPDRHAFALLVMVLALGAAAPAARQRTLPDAVRAAADAISQPQLAWDVAYLASDALLGRNTPSPGFDTAAAYITGRLERAGVEPLGDSGGFRQHYDLHESRVDTNGARLEIGEHRLRFGDDFVIRSFAGPLDGLLPVVYVGHGWAIPDRGIDPYSGVDVRGKMVLVHGPRAPKGIAITQIGRVTVNARSPLVEAERLGAAGVLFITQASELVRWDELRSANTVRRELDPPVPSAYAAPGVTSLLLSPHATEALLEGEAVTGREALGNDDAAEYPASFQLTKTIAIRVPVASRTIYRPYNVVAIVRGSDERVTDEYITVEAHLDGAVGSRTVDGDPVYNSADDNASGSAAMLAIAEQMMKAPRPKRSVIFIWDSGEEQGLWGTRRFVHDPPVPRGQIAAHVNIDMIGASRRPGSADEKSAAVTEPNEVFLIGPGVLSGAVDGLLERVNADYLKLRFNRAYDRPDSEFFYPRTDAGPFLERGILTIGFTTGIHDRYHHPSDEARFLDPAQMHAIARTVFASIWMLADADERPAIDRTIPLTVPRHP
ncbi:MAG TPA: M28 family peptidase [Vicinamibacterales bacterium]|nr:M28 family peptidase [Vicinamibacterales bacterium]